MIFRKWLIVNERGTARIVGQRPKMNADEVAIFLEIELPNALFSKPQLTATLKIPAAAVPSSTINADVIDNVEHAIKTATGLEMRVSVVDPPDDEG